jgi:hypothetical protein
MRFQKNSFIFIETIFSILILSFLVATLFKVNLSKEQKLLQLNTIDNQFKQKSYDENFITTNQTINFIKNENENLHINVKKITYETSKVKLIKYEK